MTLSVLLSLLLLLLVIGALTAAFVLKESRRMR